MLAFYPTEQDYTRKSKAGQKNRPLLHKTIPQESFYVSWGICFYSVYHWVITIFLLTR